MTPDAALQLTPDQAAGQLEAMRQRDLSARDSLDDAWIPQLSSKCVGLAVDIGPGWFPDGFAEVSSVTTEQILAYHLALQQRHGALTVARADVSTSAEGVCQDRAMWVSLAPVRFTSADGALGWCADQGYNADECAARYLVARGESGTELKLRD